MNYLKTMNDIIKTTNTYKNFIKALKNATKKDFRAGITLTNNEIKDIMKVIKSSENRGTFLKGTTTKFNSKEGGFLIFFRPLMAAGLSLMKGVLTSR